MSQEQLQVNEEKSIEVNILKRATIEEDQIKVSISCDPVLKRDIINEILISVLESLNPKLK